MCSGPQAGSYVRRIDSFVTQLKAQGPFRTCNESKEEEEVLSAANTPGAAARGDGRDRRRARLLARPRPPRPGPFAVSRFPGIRHRVRVMLH